MKQDLELMRKILFAIEEQYQPGEETMWGPSIDGYDIATVAEHCQILCDKGLIRSFLASRGNDQIMNFRIGNLTADGYDYLGQVRDDKVWKTIKAVADEENAPKTLESFSKLAGVFWGNFFDQMKG